MSVHQKDAELLAGLGYRQEFRRGFRPVEVLCMAFSVIGLVPSIASTISLFLPNGGAVALVWGWTVCGVFGMIVACTIAELSSAAPTAGGLYFWTFKYASPRWRNLLSWIVGYSNTMGLVAGMAGVEWGCAVQLMAAVSIGSNFSFTPTTAQLYAVFVALSIVTAIAASLATETLARTQGAYVCLNILLALALTIGLPISTPQEFKNSAADVFGKFSNLYGWPSGFAFVLGFAGPLWVMAGYDTPVHMSEEASGANTTVPIAIIASLGTALVLGFGVNVSLAFNMGSDIESIMASPIGQPLATIFFNSFGNRGTLVVWAFVVLAQFGVAANFLVTCSRQAFAFSRDGALPLSRYLYRMNSYTQTPVNCVWAVTFVASLLGLLSFAGPTAINAIFSLGVVGAYLAYTILICSRLFGPTPWRPGAFSLGKLSIPAAVTSVVWGVFAIVVVMFPASPNPTGETMNYTVVVGGGWIGLCILYFYFPKYGGVHWFKGPLANLDQLDSERQASESLAEAKDEKTSQSDVIHVSVHDRSSRELDD